jgi:hypothetical protein
MNAIVTEPIGKRFEGILQKFLHRIVKVSQTPGHLVPEVGVDLRRNGIVQASGLIHVCDVCVV